MYSMQPASNGMVQQPMLQQPMVQQPMMMQPMVQQPILQQPMPMVNTTTVVVNNQSSDKSTSRRAWSTGLCGCFDDVCICLLVMICPVCYAFRLATKADESCCIPIVVPAWMIALRSHIRGKHSIEGSICNDCMQVTCCFQLSMCQLSRELDNIRNRKAPM